MKYVEFSLIDLVAHLTTARTPARLGTLPEVKYHGVRTHGNDDHWQKTKTLVAFDDNYKMEFEWWITVIADVHYEYEHCPVYMMGEMILSTETLNFVEGQKIDQFFDFYMVDQEATEAAKSAEKERAAVALEEEKVVEQVTTFSETVEVSAIYPGDGKIFDQE